MGKTYYDCPCCEREVWVHSFWGAAFVGAVCNSCRDDHGNYTTSSCSVNGPAKRRRDQRKRDAAMEQARRDRDAYERERTRRKEKREKEEAKRIQDEIKKKQEFRKKQEEEMRLRRVAEQTKRDHMKTLLAKQIADKEAAAKQIRAMKKKNNPFKHFKTMKTHQFIQEIAERVEKVGAAGEILGKQIGDIKAELKQSLGDEFSDSNIDGTMKLNDAHLRTKNATFNGQLDTKGISSVHATNDIKVDGIVNVNNVKGKGALQMKSGNNFIASANSTINAENSVVDIHSVRGILDMRATGTVKDLRMKSDNMQNVMGHLQGNTGMNVTESLTLDIGKIDPQQTENQITLQSEEQIFKSNNEPHNPTDIPIDNITDIAACSNESHTTAENVTDDYVVDDYIDGTVSIQSEEQIFSADIISAPLKSTETLLNLVNQFKSNEIFQTALSDPNLLAEYTTGNGSNESSASPSHSGESKRNSDDENSNNSNDDHESNDNNHNDEQDRKDDNDPDENDSNANEKCTIHEYGCNVSWHVVRLKQLEDENRQLVDENRQLVDENRQLKLLLQKQSGVDEIDNISQPYDNTFNVEEKKQNDLVNTSLNLKIAAKLTKKTIPDNTDENFNDVFDYMNKYTHIYNENVIKDYKHQQKEIKVIDYGIHCKKTQKTLYVVCEKKNACNGVETVWKTNDNLYFDCELEQMYKIPKTNLSLPVIISDTIAMDIKNAQKQITYILQNKTRRNNIIGHKNTPWANEDKIPINNKKSKQSGLTLVLEKHEFVQKVEIFANKNVNNIKLIPIVRFNNANEYFYEIVWIVEIGKHINIGISFMHNKNNGYLPSAIYLDIHDEHKLVAYTHNCKCLESFNCIIDRLQIGDSKETRMHKRYKSKMRKQIKENENQMQNYLRLREQDMLIIDGIKKTCKNLQSDLQSLLERQSSLNQQQIACNQLHVMNAMNTLPLPPQPIPQYTFQGYNNQLVTQMDNLNRNQQQKDVN